MRNCNRRERVFHIVFAVHGEHYVFDRARGARTVGNLDIERLPLGGGADVAGANVGLRGRAVRQP